MSYSEWKQQYKGLRAFLDKEKDPEQRRILIKGLQHTVYMLREFEKAERRFTYRQIGNYK